jgi:hypothetical protein
MANEKEEGKNLVEKIFDTVTNKVSSLVINIIVILSFICFILAVFIKPVRDGIKDIIYPSSSVNIISLNDINNIILHDADNLLIKAMLKNPASRNEVFDELFGNGRKYSSDPELNKKLQLVSWLIESPEIRNAFVNTILYDDGTDSIISSPDSLHDYSNTRSKKIKQAIGVNALENNYYNISRVVNDIPRKYRFEKLTRNMYSNTENCYFVNYPDDVQSKVNSICVIPQSTQPAITEIKCEKDDDNKKVKIEITGNGRNYDVGIFWVYN